MNNEDSAPRAPSAESPPTDPPPATDVSAPAATPTLVLHTFGECRLVQRTDGYERTLYEGSNKALALLTYLACAPGRSAMRTHVQEILWGRRPTEAAQGAVRTYLWKLRKTLGPDVIVGDEILRLTSAIEVDREQMLDAANRGDMEAAVAFFAGDFFPAYAQPDSPEFDEWVYGERVRLRGIFARCAERAVANAIDGGRFRDATNIARQLRDLDPLDETGWRLLLNALTVSGDSPNAMTEADALERMLVAEERDPLPTTAATIKAARQRQKSESDADDTPSRLVAPLIGRDREFTALSAAWLRARTVSFTHIHVRGAAGMGKSRLLEDFAARTTRDKASVARARADMGRRALPYAFVGSVAAALVSKRGARGISSGSASALLAINPSLSSHLAGTPDQSTGDDALRRRTLALQELIAAVSDEQPLVLSLDDLQWADSASTAVIAGAVAGLDDAKCMLLTASRDVLSPALAASLDETIAIVGLDRDGVTELVLSLAALPDEPWARTLPDLLYQTTSGLPLHLLDALVLAMERGALTRDAQQWRSDDPVSLELLLKQGATLPRRIESIPADPRKVLLALAVAGESCELSLITSLQWLHETDIPTTLAQLEQSGYVVVNESRWAAAHDSIIDAVLALASDGDRQRAHADMAHAICSRAESQSDALARVTLRAAVSHAIRAGSDLATRAAFSACVHRARRTGDSRTLEWIAADALGDMDTAINRARLVASLPRRDRLRDQLASRWRLVAAVAATALLAGAAGAYIATRTPPPVIDGQLTVWRMVSKDSVRLYVQPISMAAWPVGTPLELRDAKPLLTLSVETEYGAVKPTGRAANEWIVSLSAADSTTTDLYLLSPNQPPRRLTFSRGDDLEPSVSPDGQRVVFASARWSTVGARSLAILDLRTLAVSRLTSGDNTDGVPAWSPDGLHVAFSRRTAETFEFCVVMIDGRDVTCPITPTASRAAYVLAWQDHARLLVSIDNQLARANIDSGTMTIVDTARAYRVASPDGRWLLTSFIRTADSRTVCTVAPTAALDQTREIQFAATGSQTCADLNWLPMPTSSPRYVRRVHIVRSAGDPVVRVPYRLIARAEDVAGDSVSTLNRRALAWSVNDTALASIAADGTLIPKRTGEVLMRLSYGGWRTDSLRISVVPRQSHLLLNESWQEELGAHWQPFGAPSPRVVTTDDGGHAMLNNGDGVFQSGVHSLTTYPLQHGLSLDAIVSTTITMNQWQVVRIGMYAGVDSISLARWNHADGWAFGPGRSSNAGCDFVYPSGTEGMRTYAESYAAAATQNLAPAAWRTGAWFRIRLQVLPDGRCAFSGPDGAVIYSESIPADVRNRAHIFIYGNSPNTNMLVGPVTIVEGIPDGVDWVPKTPPLPRTRR